MQASAPLNLVTPVCWTCGRPPRKDKKEAAAEDADEDVADISAPVPRALNSTRADTGSQDALDLLQVFAGTEDALDALQTYEKSVRPLLTKCTPLKFSDLFGGRSCSGDNFHGLLSSHSRAAILFLEQLRFAITRPHMLAGGRYSVQWRPLVTYVVGAVKICTISGTALV